MDKSSRTTPGDGRSPSGPRFGWPKFASALVGAFGGFFLGGYAGAAIEGDSCRCDDPGLKGFIIGAPIGAILGSTFGAILGARSK